MTVYTRVGRHHVPLWVMVVLSPFWLVYLIFAVLWLTVVWSVKALVWMASVLHQGCVILNSPRAVDSDGDAGTG